jgi:hypothetical protein
MGTPFSINKDFCVSGTALFEFFPAATTAWIVSGRHLSLSDSAALVQNGGKLRYGFNGILPGINGNVCVQLGLCNQRPNLLLAIFTGYNQLQWKLLATTFLTGVSFEAAVGRVMLPCILPAFEEKLVRHAETLMN